MLRGSVGSVDGVHAIGTTGLRGAIACGQRVGWRLREIVVGDGVGKRGATTRTDAGYLGDACGDGCVVTEPTFWAFYLHAEWFKAPAARLRALKRG